MLLDIIQHSSNGLLDTLLQWDRSAFMTVNTHWVNAFGDFIFPILRYPKTWIPLFAVLFIYAVIRFKWKIIPWVVFALICVTLTDQISSHFLKYYFHRLRPCQDPSLQDLARLLVNRCPGNPSFPSSHAINYFGIGTFFFYSLRRHCKKWVWLFFLWAAAISYAQVYVGVHYPIDVIGGAILGFLLGGLVAFLFVKYFNFQKGFWSRQ